MGDAAFQRKCLRRIHDVAHAGRTIVFVSHNLNAVRTLCSRAVWLDRGSIRAEGSATSIVASYLASGSDTTLTRRWEATNELPPSSAQLLCARILAEKSPEATLSIRNPVGIELEFEHSFTVGELHVDMQLFDLNGLCVLRSFAPPKTFHPGVVRARCHIPADLLNAGGYRIGLAVVRDHTTIVATADDALRFELAESERAFGWFGEWNGVVRPLLPWEITQAHEAHERP